MIKNTPKKRRVREILLRNLLTIIEKDDIIVSSKGVVHSTLCGLLRHHGGRSRIPIGHPEHTVGNDNETFIASMR